MPNDCKGLFDVLNKSVVNETVDSIVGNIEDNFTSNLSYFKVYKNYDYNESYDSIIIDSSDWRESVSRKKIIMYPYQEVNTGDYIHWTYGGELTDWLVLSTDKQYPYKESGEIRKTNNVLNWYNTYGELISWRCVYGNKLNETAFDYSRYMTAANGDIFIHIQSNSDTEEIATDDRFILNGTPFKVRQINKFIGDNVLFISLQFDAVQNGDDLVNNIANADQHQHSVEINQGDFDGSIGDVGTFTATVKLDGEVSTEPVEWISSDPAIVSVAINGTYEMMSNGNATITCRMINNISGLDTINISVSATPAIVAKGIILPDDNEILQGDTETYTVYNYKNNVQQVDTYTITVFDTGVPSANYILTSIDGNNFSIENVEKYQDSDLTVLCTNDVDATTVSINVALKGAW